METWAPRLQPLNSVSIEGLSWPSGVERRNSFAWLDVRSKDLLRKQGVSRWHVAVWTAQVSRSWCESLSASLSMQTHKLRNLIMCSFCVRSIMLAQLPHYLWTCAGMLKRAHWTANKFLRGENPQQHNRKSDTFRSFILTHFWLQRKQSFPKLCSQSFTGTHVQIR